ncbi:MAG: hypothetical protein HC805_03370, partial [Alkalinema sp. RL_2_19]|nr:hypothetical protein [Alkalinema sp. RL_2_19]
MLDQLATQAGVPTQRSVAVRESERDLLVTLVARDRLPLKTILTWVEETQDLRFQAHAQQLVVETGHEARDRDRRHVALSATDYGMLLPVRDRVGRTLGFSWAGRGGGGFSLFAAGPDDAVEGLDPAEVMDALRSHLTP